MDEPMTTPNPDGPITLPDMIITALGLSASGLASLQVLAWLAWLTGLGKSRGHFRFFYPWVELVTYLALLIVFLVGGLYRGACSDEWRALDNHPVERRQIFTTWVVFVVLFPLWLEIAFVAWLFGGSVPHSSHKTSAPAGPSATSAGTTTSG